MKQPAAFDTERALDALRHYLPSQTPLKDFVHHNSLHAFQDQPFYEAIFQASHLFGYQVTLSLQEYRKLYETGRIRLPVLEQVINDRYGPSGQELWMERVLRKTYDAPFDPVVGRLRALWKWKWKTDLDNLVHPLLFRITGAYLDQGVASWHFPFEDKGLLPALRLLDEKGFASFFHTQRARRLLQDTSVTMADLLNILVGDVDYFENYLFDQQFAHKGWSGMVATVESHPDTLLYPKQISLHDLVMVECLLEIDALDRTLGNDRWSPIAAGCPHPPVDFHQPYVVTEFDQVRMIWQDAFEWSYYDEVLGGLRHVQRLRASEPEEEESGGRKSFQAIFCIDEREDSLRRHLEQVDPDAETLGAPGFFGVSFYFRPAGGKFVEKLCPAPVTPRHLIVEEPGRGHRKKQILHTRRSHSILSGFVIALSLGLWAAVKLLLDLFRPKMEPAISDAFSHMYQDAALHIEHRGHEPEENGCQVGFTVPEMAERVENLLRGIGLTADFASIVYVVGHGSSSANNPHHGAHDCGACSGRPGSVNARVFAFMANHPEVRLRLDERGLSLPATTRFVGALHDTASDEIAFYDVRELGELWSKDHGRNAAVFEEALDHNARERSRRFASINTRADRKKVREAIRRRSVSYFEPRPELGHGTNALCFVGHRRLTRGLFLDRRAFMNSYDHRQDPDGRYLLEVIKPLPTVCGGINLEYYFSRVDNERLGAGTKLPHHVMGLIGVSNSSDGDLRPGLPLQMIEVHDPIRLLILVEHHPEVVLRTIRQLPELHAWFEKEWVLLVAIDPSNGSFHLLREGQFILYEPIWDQVTEVGNMEDLIRSAKEMATNAIVDATRENLPVHVLKKPVRPTP